MKYSQVMEQVRTSVIASALSGHPADAIAQVEDAYYQQISSICDMVTHDHIHLLLVTGPSASGKTTTAKKLALELHVRGKRVNRLSLDNFYKSSDELPRWEDGYQNYESVEGLDLQCFERVMQTLFRDGRAQFPIFDFTAGRRAEKTFELTFDNHTYLIIEGIHALNPVLAPAFHGHRTVKTYISVHSDFVNDQGDLLMSARDLRLTRRLLRDYYYRGTAADETLKMWDYVLRGEDLYIRPYRIYADRHVNSVHNYEPFLYRDALCRLLEHPDSDSPYHETIERLRACAAFFFPIDQSLIPPASLIQEFIKQN
ncbi:uridine kinase family protein [Anaerotruncus colihominis]|uniref:uridine kinase family protein n=1 Tax=Anaerotruncus colihominis TaxID=169435 RepID=UPI0024306195|nr:hypothetical protein [Anaerotruncus colihominis]